MITIELANAIKEFGFPIVAAFGLGYFVYYVWTWVTKEIKPVLGEANTTPEALAWSILYNQFLNDYSTLID